MFFRHRPLANSPSPANSINVIVSNYTLIVALMNSQCLALPRSWLSSLTKVTILQGENFLRFIQQNWYRPSFFRLLVDWIDNLPLNGSGDYQDYKLNEDNGTFLLLWGICFILQHGEIIYFNTGQSKPTFSQCQKYFTPSGSSWSRFFQVRERLSQFSWLMLMMRNDGTEEDDWIRHKLVQCRSWEPSRGGGWVHRECWELSNPPRTTLITHQCHDTNNNHLLKSWSWNNLSWLHQY